jgi:hypothetical protein
MDQKIIDTFLSLENFCHNKCIKRVSGNVTENQENCFDNCLKKTSSAWDFLRKYSETEGVSRNVFPNE